MSDELETLDPEVVEDEGEEEEEQVEEEREDTEEEEQEASPQYVTKDEIDQAVDKILQATQRGMQSYGDKLVDTVARQVNKVTKPTPQGSFEELVAGYADALGVDFWELKAMTDLASCKTAEEINNETYKNWN